MQDIVFFELPTVLYTYSLMSLTRYAYIESYSCVKYVKTLEQILSYAYIAPHNSYYITIPNYGCTQEQYFLPGVWRRHMHREKWQRFIELYSWEQDEGL